MMTGNVLITIKSVQLGFEENPIETMQQGSYSFLNGSHCISYEEQLTDSNSAIKNIIRITPQRVTVTKKGTAVSKLIFDTEEITDTNYHTPYGSLSLSIMTKSIHLEVGPDLIKLKLEYSLLSGSSPVSDNQLVLLVTPLQTA